MTEKKQVEEIAKDWEKELDKRNAAIKLELSQSSPLDNVTLLWHSNYYDGVLSGVVLYENKPHWIDLAIEDDSGIYDESTGECTYGPEGDWFRKFWIYELDHNNCVRLFSEHGLFQGHVGLHTDCFPFHGRKSTFGVAKDKLNPLHYGGVFGPDPTQTYWKIYEKSREMLRAKNGDFKVDECKKIGWVYYEDLFKNLKK